MEKPNFTKKEELRPEFNILKFNDILDQVYKGGNLPEDPRFFSPEEGGVFKYFEPRNLIDGDFRDRANRIFPVIKLDKEIVALSELKKDPLKVNNLWIKFICVDPKYQNNGYATNLIKEIFKFAKENNYSLETSIYSDEGLEKIKKTIDKMESETGVNVINRSKF